MTVEGDGSSPRADDAGDRPDQGGLAGPVRAEHGHGFPIADLEVDPVEDGPAAVGHMEARHGEHQPGSPVGPAPGGSSSLGGVAAGGKGWTPRRKAAWTRVSAATSSGSPCPTTAPVSRT